MWKESRIKGTYLILILYQLQLYLYFLQVLIYLKLFQIESEGTLHQQFYTLKLNSIAENKYSIWINMISISTEVQNNFVLIFAHSKKKTLLILSYPSGKKATLFQNSLRWLSIIYIKRKLFILFSPQSFHSCTLLKHLYIMVN